jgi:hypothetical protein
VPAALESFHAALDELEVEIVSRILSLLPPKSVNLIEPSFKPKKY